MGYSEDIMYVMALKDLRTVFAEYDGWHRSQLSSGIAGEKVFSFSRRFRGKAEQGIALVSFLPEISPEISSEFSGIAGKMPGCTKKILLVPRSTVVPFLSPEIEIKEMKVFGHDGGRLVWLTKKKNAMSYMPKTGIEA